MRVAAVSEPTLDTDRRLETRYIVKQRASWCKRKETDLTSMYSYIISRVLSDASVRPTFSFLRREWPVSKWYKRFTGSLRQLALHPNGTLKVLYLEGTVPWREFLYFARTFYSAIELEKLETKQTFIIFSIRTFLKIKIAKKSCDPAFLIFLFPQPDMEKPFQYNPRWYLTKEINTWWFTLW